MARIWLRSRSMDGSDALVEAIYAISTLDRREFRELELRVVSHSCSCDWEFRSGASVPPWTRLINGLRKSHMTELPLRHLHARSAATSILRRFTSEGCDDGDPSPHTAR